MGVHQPAPRLQSWITALSVVYVASRGRHHFRPRGSAVFLKRDGWYEAYYVDRLADLS